MTGLLLLAALFSAPFQQEETPSADPSLLDQYVDERVSYRFGTAFDCDLIGGDRVLATVAKRLSGIRVGLVEQFGEAEVAKADARIEPRFVEEMGGVSMGGCGKGSASDSGRLRAFRDRRYEALDALEGAIKAARKVDQ